MLQRAWPALHITLSDDLGSTTIPANSGVGAVFSASHKQREGKVSTTGTEEFMFSGKPFGSVMSLYYYGSRCYHHKYCGPFLVSYLGQN